MTLVAGIDIGNATTEIVFGRVVDGWSRRSTPTRCRRAGRRARRPRSPQPRHWYAGWPTRWAEPRDQAAVAQLTPVHTGVVSGVAAGAATGRLEVVPIAGKTLVRAGAGVGRGVWLEDLESASGPVVALVRAGTGYDATAAALNRSRAEVVAVALADDEAVLVGNRLERRVPVVDQLPVERLAASSLVAVEVAHRRVRPWPGWSTRSG